MIKNVRSVIQIVRSLSLNNDKTLIIKDFFDYFSIADQRSDTRNQKYKILKETINDCF
jgi:hypothetical protein